MQKKYITLILLYPRESSDCIKVLSKIALILGTERTPRTILCNLCKIERPMGTEHFLCARRGCGTVFPIKFVNVAPYLFLKRTIRLSYFQNL